MDVVNAIAETDTDYSDRPLDEQKDAELYFAKVNGEVKTFEK